MNGIYFPHMLIIIINSNTLIPLINDTTRQKVESSNDLLFAINANDNYILELFGWNGSYKYIRTR